MSEAKAGGRSQRVLLLLGRPRHDRQLNVVDSAGEPVVKPVLIKRTCKVWQPRLGRELSREDARQIAENVTGLFRIRVIERMMEVGR